MLNCPRKFGLTFFIDCMVKLCVRAFQNCIIANISTRFAALSHPRQLACFQVPAFSAARDRSFLPRFAQFSAAGVSFDLVTSMAQLSAA